MLELEENIDIINSHKPIDETEQLQSQLLSMNESLLDAANQAKKTLQSMDAEEGNQFLEKIESVNKKYTSFNDMLERLRMKYEY